MKTQYSARLRCATCGNDSDFESNDDKTYIKCNICNREYLGGYDELVSLNAETIRQVKEEIHKDVKRELDDIVKKAFRGSKFVKVR